MIFQTNLSKIPSNKHQVNDYRLKDNIFLVSQDETTQILDFQEGKFYALDSIAAQMLSLVLEKGFDYTVTHIAQNYETTKKQIQIDLNLFLSQLENQKLIISPEKTKNSSIISQVERTISLLMSELIKAIAFVFRKIYNSSENPNPITVNLLLSLSWLSFRLLGWSRTLTLWQTWHKTQEIVASNEQEEILQQVDKIVREAAASKLFFPIVCKERALVGYHLLRVFYKLPAYLIVGINRHPFQLHAWVECEGKIITDDAAHCEAFIPVVRYPENKDSTKINHL